MGKGPAEGCGSAHPARATDGKGAAGNLGRDKAHNANHKKKVFRRAKIGNLLTLGTGAVASGGWPCTGGLLNGAGGKGLHHPQGTGGEVPSMGMRSWGATDETAWAYWARKQRRRWKQGMGTGGKATVS